MHCLCCLCCEALPCIPPPHTLCAAEPLQYLVVTDGSAPGEPGGVEQGVLVRAVAGMLGKGEVT